MQRVEQESGLLRMYNASFKSKYSARCYTYSLNKYADNDLESLLKLSQREAEDRLIDFIITNKEKGVSWGALHNTVAAVSKFYLINDVSLNLKRVKRFMPEQVKLKKDRAYRTEEIHKILELTNERTRALILLLSSSGMRLGGVTGLKMSDLEDKGDIYKITVYVNTNSEYITYVTPECKQALDTYFNIRKMHGEDFGSNKKNPVIREQYNKESPLSVKYPKFMTKGALTAILEEILERAGLRTRIQRTEKANANYKKDVSLSTGFRKRFNTELANAGINPLIKELLMGHHVGLEDNYYRPQEQDIANEFLKAIDNLTIDPANRLRRELKITKAKQDEIASLKLDQKNMHEKIDYLLEFMKRNNTNLSNSKKMKMGEDEIKALHDSKITMAFDYD